MTESHLGDGIPGRAENTQGSRSFAEALRPAIAKWGGEEGTYDWSNRAQPTSVDVTFRRLVSLSKDELPVAIDSIHAAFAPPSEGDDDTRTRAEREVYKFVDGLVTLPIEDPEIIDPRLQRIRSIYDQSKDQRDSLDLPDDPREALWILTKGESSSQDEKDQSVRAKDGIRQVFRDIGLTDDEKQQVLAELLKELGGEMPEDVYTELRTLVGVETARRKAGQEIEGLNEVKETANRLAVLTREQGVGYITSIVPRDLQENFGGLDRHQQAIRGFEPRTILPRGGADRDLVRIFTHNYNLNEVGSAATLNDGRHALTIAPYGTRITYDDRIGRRDIAFDRRDPGMDGWVQIEYEVPIVTPYQGDNRRYDLTYTIAVPPDLAPQIISAADTSPYFSNEYFQAVFPGVVGGDITKQVKMKPATELFKRDLRKTDADPRFGQSVPLDPPIQTQT